MVASPTWAAYLLAEQRQGQLIMGDEDVRPAWPRGLYNCLRRRWALPEGRQAACGRLRGLPAAWWLSGRWSRGWSGQNRHPELERLEGV